MQATTTQTETNEVRPDLTGVDLLRNPMRNKDAAFSPEERRALGLHGLLQQTVEQFSAFTGFAAVESKCEFVEVIVKVFAANGPRSQLYNPFRVGVGLVTITRGALRDPGLRS